MVKIFTHILFCACKQWLKHSNIIQTKTKQLCVFITKTPQRWQIDFTDNWTDKKSRLYRLNSYYTYLWWKYNLHFYFVFVFLFLILFHPPRLFQLHSKILGQNQARTYPWNFHEKYWELAELENHILFYFCHWVFQKYFWRFFSMNITMAFIWGSICFCTMVGFFRILKKALSKLICTRL